MVQGRVRVPGENEWHEMKYTPVTEGILITGPKGLVDLIWGYRVEVLLCDGTARMGHTDKHGTIMFEQER